MIITGKSDNLIIAVQANNKKEVEINGHPIQAKRLDNVTSESSGQNRGRSEQFWKQDAISMLNPTNFQVGI